MKASDVMPSDDAESTRFVNVDFDVECDSGGSELAAALSREAIVLHGTGDSFSFELNRDYETVQICLEHFINMIGNLSPRARGIWDGCRRRTANIGIQACAKPYSAAFPISRESIASLAAIGCDVTITVYAPPNDGSTGPSDAM